MAKKSLYQQLKIDLRKQFGAGKGQSRHLDKRIPNGTKEKIYSVRTYEDYSKTCKLFATWIAETHPEIDTKSGAREYASEWLHSGEWSAWTVRKYASALAKTYHCTGNEIYGESLPRRERCDISRDRGEMPDIDPAVRAALESCGLRSMEARALTVDDVSRADDGQVYVTVRRGKGGKSRIVEAVGDAIYKLAHSRAVSGFKRVFDALPRNAVHKCRAAFAAAVYHKHARPISEIDNPKEIVTQQKDRTGEQWDRLAVQEVSRQLGHNRESVVLVHYSHKF